MSSQGTKVVPPTFNNREEIDEYAADPLQQVKNNTSTMSERRKISSGSLVSHAARKRMQSLENLSKARTGPIGTEIEEITTPLSVKA